MARRISSIISVVVLGLLSTSYSNATECSTDCADKCRRCFLGACGAEPHCQATCEVERLAACGGGGEVTLTPDLGKELDSACGSPFNAYVSSVKAACTTGGDAHADANVIGAWAILVRDGYFKQPELAGVSIRWCNLQTASGMVPDRDFILLDHSHRDWSANDLAPLLAHEMVHVRQIRSFGTDAFKCSYSKELLAGKGMQRSNYLEREAYELEDRVKDALKATANTYRPPTRKPGGDPSEGYGDLPPGMRPGSNSEITVAPARTPRKTVEPPTTVQRRAPTKQMTVEDNRETIEVDDPNIDQPPPNGMPPPRN